MVPIVARRRDGLDALRRAIDEAAKSAPAAPQDLPVAGASLDTLMDWADHVSARVMRYHGSRQIASNRLEPSGS